MTIGQRIALKRKEQALSQESLGELLGVSRQSVYKWESDAALPEIDKLIAMSRLFAVTVGWLLGVEEADEDRADRQDPVGDELSEEQLRMVEEIVGRYIAAQPEPPKKRRWLRFLCTVAAVAVVWSLVKLSNELDVLSNRYNNLQNSISGVSSSVSVQISGIANRVEEILESQNSLLASHSVEITGSDLRANTLTLQVMAAPKTYVEGMETLFLVDTGTGPVEYRGAEGAGRQFSAGITCPLTDTLAVSAVFVTGETRQTQKLYSCQDLYTGSFPYVCADGHSLLFWKDLEQGGDLRFSDQYVFLRDEDIRFGSDLVERAQVRDVKVGLFKNQELVVWLEAVEGVPERYRGFDDHRFFRVPDMTVPVSAGDVLSVGTLVLDEYGREKLYVELGYTPDSENGEMVVADAEITDKEDWYDTSRWTY